MFSVKATYRGETRKFTFPENQFPSYDQLTAQVSLPPAVVAVVT